MKPIRYHREAETEYEEAIDYVGLTDVDVGARCRIALEAARDRLQASPRSYPEDPETGCRECIEGRFHYSFHYMELDAFIWIVAVAHHSRRPGYWHRRLLDL